MDYISRKVKLRKPIVALGLIACFSATYLWTETEDPGGAIHYLDGSSGSNTNADLVDRSEYSYRQLTLEQSNEVGEGGGATIERSHHNFAVCGRATRPAQNLTPELQHKVSSCPREYDPQIPTLVLEGYQTFGRTGNQLRTLIHAMQYARDNNVQLVIMFHSWAMEVILNFFMANNGESAGDWESRLEKMLCIKIMHQLDELNGWTVIFKKSKFLFRYHSPSPYDEYVAGHVYALRRFFQHYNTGEGTDQLGREVKDMCSGIDSLFGKENENEDEDENRSSANYSVIHLRTLEHSGEKILGMVSRATGCDPKAALTMSPDYVKSILVPAGMLEHPIVIITDNEEHDALDGLMDDPDIGPVLRFVPKESSWLGGDITLGVMANVFIGNPASTLSGFIGQSRTALGIGHNYVFRAKNEDGEWYTVCENPLYNDCLFSKGNVHESQQVKSSLCTGLCIQHLKSRQGRRLIGESGSHERAKYFWPNRRLERHGKPRFVPPPSPISRLTWKRLLKRHNANSQTVTEDRNLALESKEYTGLRPDERDAYNRNKRNQMNQTAHGE